MNVYFRKNINIEKGEKYTAKDFLKNKDVKNIFNGKTDTPPILYIIILYAANIPETDTYQITKNHTILTKGACLNPKTNKTESKFDAKAIETHVNYLFDLVRPCDKLLSIYISNSEF